MGVLTVKICLKFCLTLCCPYPRVTACLIWKVNFRESNDKLQSVLIYFLMRFEESADGCIYIGLSRVWFLKCSLKRGGLLRGVPLYYMDVDEPHGSLKQFPWQNAWQLSYTGIQASWQWWFESAEVSSWRTEQEPYLDRRGVGTVQEFVDFSECEVHIPGVRLFFLLKLPPRPPPPPFFFFLFWFFQKRWRRCWSKLTLLWMKSSTIWEVNWNLVPFLAPSFSRVLDLLCDH